MILDSSVLIAAERGTLSMPELLRGLGDQPVAIAAITAAELLHGCLRATDAAVRARRFAFVDALLEAIPILPFGLVEARRHAELWAECARRGAGIGAHDLLIGATALAQGYRVATLNAAEFERMPGVELA